MVPKSTKYFYICSDSAYAVGGRTYLFTICVILSQNEISLCLVQYRILLKHSASV